MQEGRIFDLHCDSISDICREGASLRDHKGHINLDKLRRGGAMVQCFAVFVLTHREAEERGAEKDPYAYFNRVADCYYTELQQNQALIRPAYSVSDIERNRAEGRISAVLTVEDTVLLEGRLERVAELYHRGVRMAALTWNYENSVGYPNSFDPAEHRRGLKPFGREAVKKMEELGMIVDVSHLSEGGFWDVAELMKRPFVASHSCARALCDHSRNLTDSQLRAIGEHGGVCGVNFLSRFLVQDSDYTRLEDIVRHMEYIKNVAGLESVALGSDFDGIDCGLEMVDYAGMGLLTDAMSCRFTDDEIDRICALNALRVFRDTVG